MVEFATVQSNIPCRDECDYLSACKINSVMQFSGSPMAYQKYECVSRHDKCDYYLTEDVIRAIDRPFFFCMWQYYVS
jgi:hypothetical protein